jgi:hypothetical protein
MAAHISYGTSMLGCRTDASNRGEADHVRLVTSLDLLSAGGRRDAGARPAALEERFSEAGEEMSNSRCWYWMMLINCVPVQGQEDTVASCWQHLKRFSLRSPPGVSSTTAMTGGHSQAKKTKDGRNGARRYVSWQPPHDPTRHVLRCMNFFTIPWLFPFCQMRNLYVSCLQRVQSNLVCPWLMSTHGSRYDCGSSL